VSTLRKKETLNKIGKQNKLKPSYSQTFRNAVRWVSILNPGCVSLVTLESFGQWQSFDFSRSKQLFHTSQSGPSFCVLLLGHDFFIGKARLWLSERAKSRGSRRGAPETGCKSLPKSFTIDPNLYILNLLDDLELSTSTLFAQLTSALII